MLHLSTTHLGYGGIGRTCVSSRAAPSAVALRTRGSARIDERASDKAKARRNEKDHF
jgi:hypothetical protein